MNRTDENEELKNEELLQESLASDAEGNLPTDTEESQPITEGTEDTSEEEKEDIPEKKEKESSTRMRKLLRQALREDDSEGGSLKDMFNDIQISGEWLKRHWSFLLIVFVCMLAFVTNRYQAQQEIIEEANLKRELNEWKYIWLTQFSELTRSTRQSYIEESLRQRGDTTLTLSKNAPFIIKIKK